MSNNDLLKIPPFLRRYQISGELLDEAIGQLRLADQSLLADRLEGVKNTDLFCNTTGTHNTAVGHNAGHTTLGDVTDDVRKACKDASLASLNSIDASSQIRLTQVLKERTGLEIIATVRQGHNTFNKLRKKGIADDRVLRSSIRYALKHPLCKSKLVKLSSKTYGVLS